MAIDTENFSRTLRKRSIDIANQRLLITNFHGSKQEEDLSQPANCCGYGRIRHFRRTETEGWPENPLPIDPALHSLGSPREEALNAQVFQNASCNWRCWYCYVPFELLSASLKYSSWMSASDLLDFYQLEPNAPPVIVLSGGQPDLTPEWIPWMIRELKRRRLDTSVYLWSDDNLSNDYFWQYLSRDDVTLIKSYHNYGKVCCFKGFNAESFAFNTMARPHLFEQQFSLFRRYLELEIDLYGYATFTALDDSGMSREMATFVDRLQAISVNLPLRIVPLEVRDFVPVHERMSDQHHRALKVQWNAIECWKAELRKRYSEALRSKAVYEVPL
jgi:organic radical activating enzyme